MQSAFKSTLTEGALLAMTVLLAACGSTPPAASAVALPASPPAVEKGDLENAADGTAIAIKRGGELMVRLDSNLTTGYQWQGPATVAPLLTPIGNPVYVGKDPRFIGAGGVNVFRFKAEQPGTATLQFNYTRPWEANVAPVKIVRYTVSVAP